MNHRFGLFDGVLVKENHARAAGGLRQAVERAKASAHEKKLPVVVEVGTLEEALEVGAMGVDRILLDNFTPAKVAEVVKRLGLTRKAPRAKGKSGAPEAAGGTPGGAVEIEISGGVRCTTCASSRSRRLLHLDRALTHSAPALDLSLLIDEAL